MYQGIRAVLLAVALLAGVAPTYAQEVTFELKLLEMERIDWPGRSSRESFAVRVPAGVARALASTPDSKVIHRVVVDASDERATQFSVVSRDIVLSVEITPRLLPNKEIDVDLRTHFELLLDPEPPVKTQPVSHRASINLRENFVAGGFLRDADAAYMQSRPEFRENALLRYLFSEKRGQPEEPEIAIILNPRSIKWPDLPIVESTERPLSTAPLYTVQVAAGRNREGAAALVRRLQSTYEDVFIQATAGDRPVYRVRVGKLPDLTTARQLERRLRAERMDTFVTTISN